MGNRINDIADLGRYVRKRRREAGLRQEDVAAFADCSRRLLGEFENGKRDLRVSALLRILRALGIDLIPAPRGRPGGDE